MAFAPNTDNVSRERSTAEPWHLLARLGRRKQSRPATATSCAISTSQTSVDATPRKIRGSDVGWPTTAHMCIMLKKQRCQAVAMCSGGCGTLPQQQNKPTIKYRHCNPKLDGNLCLSAQIHINPPKTVELNIWANIPSAARAAYVVVAMVPVRTLRQGSTQVLEAILGNIRRRINQTLNGH